MEKKKFIQSAINPKHKGLLHQKLGIPEGEKIPAKVLDNAIKEGGTLGHEALLARTLGKMRRKNRS